jgi:methionyl-tRNA formyltransferase
MSAEADSGDLWAQRTVRVQSTDTALDLYKRLQVEITALFKETWPAIVEGTAKPTPQKHKLATYKSKSLIDNLDQINLKQVSTAGEVIQLLKARTFGGYGFAHFFDGEGEKVYVRIQLSKSKVFEN